MESSMTKGRPLTLLLKFVLPIFLGFIFQQFYNMVDTVIVGRYVSPTALAAVGSTGTIMFLVIGLAIGMTTGFSVLTSQKFGAGKLEETKRSVANGIITTIEGNTWEAVARRYYEIGEAYIRGYAAPAYE